MKKAKIRLARKEDVKAIEDMILEWSTSQWPEWLPKRTEAILKALEDPNHLVSEINEEIVGVLHLIFYSDILLGSSNCHLNFLLVKERYRSTGVGSRLINEAVKQAKEKGAIEMHVDTKFDDAAKFYRKLGFKDDGVWLELRLMLPRKQIL